MIQNYNTRAYLSLWYTERVVLLPYSLCHQLENVETEWDVEVSIAQQQQQHKWLNNVEQRKRAKTAFIVIFVFAYSFLNFNLLKGNKSSSMKGFSLGAHSCFQRASCKISNGFTYCDHLRTPLNIHYSRLETRTDRE